MLTKLLVPLFLAGVIGIAALDEFGSAEPAGAGPSAADADSPNEPAAEAAASTSQTGKAVAAAQAFKSALSGTQQDSVQYSFTSSKKTSGWSNLPVGAQNARNGLAIAELSAEQVDALRKLLKASLSRSGFAEEESVRAADDYLASLQSGGGGGPTGQYGAGKYYIALFGTPSTSKKWTVQFGGHHLALHVTFNGSKVTGTPYFVGVEPLSFTVAEKGYAPLAGDSKAMVALFKSLNDPQLKAAKLRSTFDDVLLGPGQDGKFPKRRGQRVSELSARQKNRLTNAIEQWVGDVNSAGAKKILATYKKGYAKTRVAWATSIDPGTDGAYMRIDGPKVWIEMISQAGVVTPYIHYHSIWRDRTGDYGAG